MKNSSPSLPSIVRQLLSRAALSPIAAPILAGLILFGVVFTIWDLTKTDQLVRLNADMRSNVEIVATRLQVHIETRLNIAEHIRYEWNEGNFKNLKEFSVETKSIHELFKDFQAINWVDPQGTIQWVTPYVGNEAAQGLDLWALAVPGATLTEVIKTGQTRVTQQIELAQGGAGFAIYMPLIKNDIIEGFLNFVFRTNALVEGALPKEISTRYHLIIMDGEQTVYDNGQMSGSYLNLVKVPISVGDRTWNVMAVPTSLLLKESSTIIDELTLLIGLLLSLITAYLIHLTITRQLSLHESEVRFREFAEVASDWFWEMDDQLRFTYFSDRSRELTGFDPSSYIGKTRREVAAEQILNEKWQDHLKDLENHLPFRDFAYNLERKDGRILSISISGKPVFDPRGIFCGYRGTGTDITESKTAESESMRKQQQMKTAAELAKLGYWEWDEVHDCATYYSPDLIDILDINPDDYVDGEWVGDMDRQHIYPDDLEHYHYISTFSEGKEDRFDIEYRSLKQNGDIIYLREIGETIRNESGEIVQSFGIVQDITDNKQSAVALQVALRDADRANQAKSDFLANMSHELRTPLNSIIGFSDMLKMETFGPVGQNENKEYIEFINGSGIHLLNIISDILDLSKIEAGKEEISDEDLNIPDLINEAQNIITNQASIKQLLLPINIQPYLPSLRADKRKILQIILNLYSNAIKFTPEKGTVSIKATLNQEGDFLIIMEDTGIGIAPEDLETVMEPFGQAGKAHTRSYDGTGLGLALVKSLAEMHGGSAYIESILNEGTVVTVRFPPERIVVSEGE